VRATSLAKSGNRDATALADLFCRAARERVDRLFDEFYGKYDAALYRVAQQVMKGEHAWLETGIISPLEPSAEARLESRPSATALAAD
jgi:hypothetical protein